MEGSQRDIIIAAKSGGLKVFGSILTILGGLGIGVLLTRTLGAEGFGQYRLGIITAELLAQIGAIGIPSAALLFIPRAVRRRDGPHLIGVFRVTLGFPAIAGILLGIGAFIFADEISSRVFHDSGIAPTLRIFALAIPLHSLLDSSESIARAFNRLDISLIGRDVCFQACKMVMTACLLLAGYGIGGAAAAHVMALVISVGLLFVLVRRLIPARAEVPGVEYRFRGIWRQSLPMYVTRIFQAFGAQVENLMLGFFGLTSGVGIYAAALQVSRIGDMIPESIYGTSLPVLSEAYDRGGALQVHSILRAGTRWGLTVTLLIFVVIVLFAAPLLSIFGKEFTAGRNALILLACLPVLRASSGLIASTLAMSGYAKVNAMNSVLYLFAAFSMDLVLIPGYGVFGAAIAAFSAMSFLSAIRLLEIYWLFRISPYDRNLLKPLIAAAIAAATGHLVAVYLASVPPLIQTAIGVVLVCVSYLAILIALGLTAEDRLIIQKFWHRVRRQRRDRY